MSSSAEIYERNMVPHHFAPLAEQVVARAQPQPGERVLDVACGTGVVARRVAPFVGLAGQVTGLDLSPGMLAVASKMAAEERLVIDWHEGRAEELPFDDESFDLVICQHGLQFMPDRLAAVAEMRRVLRDGGRVVISVNQRLETRPFEYRLNAIIEERLGVGPLRQASSLGDAHELQGILEASGLRAVSIEPHSFMARFPDPDGYLTTRIHVIVAAIPSMQVRTPDEVENLLAEVRAALTPVLREYVVGNELVLPVHAQIAQAVR